MPVTLPKLSCPLHSGTTFLVYETCHGTLDYVQGFLISIIPATWEAEAGRLQSKANPTGKSTRPYLKNSYSKKG
jgi:hypothetical protein